MSLSAHNFSVSPSNFHYAPPRVFSAPVTGQTYEVVYLVDDDPHTREQVCAFLGVDHIAKRFGRAAEPVHVGPARELPPSVLEVLKVRFRPIYEGFAALYPEIGARWAARYYPP